jgi:hypothetical protein
VPSVIHNIAPAAGLVEAGGARRVGRDTGDPERAQRARRGIGGPRLMPRLADDGARVQPAQQIEESTDSMRLEGE